MANLPARSTDRLMLVEVGLALALIALAINLYLRPARTETLTSAEWWHWVLMAGLFFGIVGVHTFRRKRLGRMALHDVIREDARNREGTG